MKKSIQSIMDTNIKSNNSYFMDIFPFIMDKIKTKIVILDSIFPTKKI